MAEAESSPTPGTAPEAAAPLPKLSAADFRVYNRMAEHMNYFHNHFRQTWTAMDNAAKTGQRPAGMTIKQFLRMIDGFCRNLTGHHTIEEIHIFPVLAKKMPRFREEMHLLTQHKQIHEGVEKLEEYVALTQSGEKELRLDELKAILDSFGTVLWAHLDDEVEQLGAENMRKFWTLQEMRSMPM